MKQLITWTALPNGISTSADSGAKVLKLSVRASVRLTPDGGSAPLSDFADFIDWTGKPWRFSVLFGDYPSSGAVTPSAANLKPMNTLFPSFWEKLFKGGAPVVVRDRVGRDFSNIVVRSFPAARILEFIKQQYTAVALESPGELPTPGWLLGREGKEGERRNGGADFSALQSLYRYDKRKSLDPLLVNGVVPYTYESDLSPEEVTRLDFLQTEHFHAPKGGRYDNKPDKPDLDFHQVMALLGDYPDLLRALGFIFDLEVPIPPDMGDVSEQIVRVWPENPLADGADTVVRTDSKVALATRYKYNAATGIFSAKASEAYIKNGHFDLSRKEFSVAQVDIDGSAIKAINFTQTLGDLGIHKQPVLGTPKNAGLPSLRSGGMSVLMNGRALEFIQKLKNGSTLETLLANPVKRDTIQFNAEEIVRGYRIDIYDEERGEWFSLCKRIGNYACAGDPKGTFLFPDEMKDEGTVTVAGIASSDSAASNDLYLHEALFHWDGWSLVLPHPGQTIKKPEQNAVDPVGYEPTDVANAIGLETSFKVAPGTLPKLRYGREYRLRARIVDIAGNSLILESDKDTVCATKPTPYLRFEPVPSPALMSEADLCPGESVDRLVIRSWAEHDATPTDETSGRHVLSPRAAVQLAELHGMIDGPAPAGATSWYSELAKRDAAQLKEWLDPGEIMAEVPYLPDPAAKGATFVGLPGVDSPLAFFADFDAAAGWPHASTFRIELQEGDAGYKWQAAEKRLVISLPKAERITVRMSSNFSGPSALNKMGIWQWIRDSAPTPWLEKLAKLAAEGRHWMLTPFRELTFIHAVQIPMEAPRVQGSSPARSAGETFFILRGVLHVHGKSTDKVDFYAEWNEVVSAPLTPEGSMLKPRSVQACRFDVSDPETIHAFLAERHELGDTKHRRISYWATAASRFREYFEDESNRLLPEDLCFTNPSTLNRPADFILDVPSSARPLAPQIEYIIPTFEWEEERHDDGVSRRRGGNSLRVYMSGDWFSSGEGELLGVVLAHGPQIFTPDGLTAAEGQALGNPYAPVPPEKLQPYVTRWGIDPIWLSGLVHQTPTVHHFPEATGRATDLTLAENPPIPADQPVWGVAVAGHPVAYDSERQLWYSDILIDAGPSYYPFIRLALARFQPCSVAGTELSRVIAADCVQTAPDRLVWVGPDPNNPFLVKVSLSGVAPRGCFNVVCPNRVIVRAEVCLSGIKDSPLWAPVAAPWVALAEMQVSKTVTVWSGSITLPQVRDAQRYRLVVEEYEFLNADPGRGFDNEAARNLRMMARVRKTAVWPRIVYSDIIELNPPEADTCG